MYIYIYVDTDTFLYLFNGIRKDVPAYDPTYHVCRRLSVNRAEPP